MIKLVIRLEPSTGYVISGEPSPDRKVEFNASIFYSYPYINPSTIKGFLRSAAVYGYPDVSCEILSSKTIISNIDRIKKKIHNEEQIRLSFMCSDIEDLLENRNSREASVYLEVLGDIIRKLKRPCKVCRVFGNGSVKGKLRIIYQIRPLNTTEIKGLKFSREYKENREGLSVMMSKDPIEFTVLCEDKECQEVIKRAVSVINDSVVRLGRFKSRGFGIVNAKIVSMST
ncbi:RAMP superfamily CRISPR-associated protein [Sulfolobus acidocaldarius]|uniref:CRISPR type III-associated protein domain-containing protein n=4 Tax=Sulfolobus acidocaldarius TaxID=2285 RepID=Q4J7N2_SULAC|nr:RAMP superfamily CRISPR-associated protein [Sulfolobus acidocaldarius]AAY81199.1 hypothetical protein Saci_1896 [Sulfolobus acidocaldarius DSM 639]AGE71819.1 hypothetical protein SacN8_09295 [Sulfolobus acidocaldarius N8]AGE74090.1 hypothetical protein SacRon12I_09315 [Sulfolobus acidocaldarius Ron12/I]ALU29987.1 hypothetical protein ATY89_08620 [Sulfolobus acidocaldarius]ALU30677.1 hypothetical protein ATZ20_00030 [Sulfolobus acidocaldarius]